MKINVTLPFKHDRSIEMDNADLQFIVKIARMNYDIVRAKNYFDKLEEKAIELNGPLKQGEILEIKFDHKSVGFQVFVLSLVTSIQSLCESYYHDPISDDMSYSKKKKIEEKNKLKVRRRSQELDNIDKNLLKDVNRLRNVALHCSSLHDSGYSLINHDFIIGCDKLCDSFNNLALDIIGHDSSLVSDLGLPLVEKKLTQYKLTDDKTGIEIFNITRI